MKKEKNEKVLLKIEGMTCSACSSGLEKYLNKQEGIKTASVNLIMNNASIEYDETEINLEQVEKYIEKAGFSSLGIDKLENEEKKKNKRKKQINRNKYNININTIYLNGTYGKTTSNTIFRHDAQSSKLCNSITNINNNSINNWKRHTKNGYKT